jgi:hypothetical protein
MGIADVLVVAGIALFMAITLGLVWALGKL